MPYSRRLLLDLWAGIRGVLVSLSWGATKDVPSLQRLLLDYRYAPSQIIVVSAPKMETFGVIPDPFKGYKMVVGSTLIQVLYIIINTFVIISCIFYLCA